MLFKDSPRDNGENVSRFVVSEVLKKQKLHSAHSIVHQGARRMMQTLYPRFYWPNMEKDVEIFCKNCAKCIVFKPPQIQTKSPVGSYCPANHMNS